MKLIAMSLRNIVWAVTALGSLSIGSLALAQSNAYIRGDTAPWGATSNEAAMTQAFGAGNWADLRMASGAGPFAAGSGYQFIYLEGSDNTANELNTYLTANRPAVEAYVAGGGCLLINSAPNEGGDIDLGFGVTLTFAPSFSTSVAAANAAHPVFNGPFTPVGTSFSGNYFGHAIVGPGLSPVIVGAPGDPQAGNMVLGETTHGSGHVMFGGMTTANHHSPQPQANNLRANILSYAAAQNCQVPVTAMGASFGAIPASLTIGQSVPATLTCINTGTFDIASATCSPSVSSGNATITNLACTPPSPTGTLAAGANISCTFDLTGNAAGPINLQGTTTGGSNGTVMVPASTTVNAAPVVTPPTPAIAPVPTLGVWGLGALAALLGWSARRRKAA